MKTLTITWSRWYICESSHDELLGWGAINRRNRLTGCDPCSFDQLRALDPGKSSEAWTGEDVG